MKVRLLKRIRERFEYKFEQNKTMLKYREIVFWDKKRKTFHESKRIELAVGFMIYILGLTYFIKFNNLSYKRRVRRSFDKAGN